MSKRIYDPATVRGLLAERERNGWSLGELSRRSGVPVGTLSTWAAKAAWARQEDAQAEGGFAEVLLAADGGESGNSTVRLRHDSGWSVELHGDAATALASKLAEAITRCS